MVWNQSQEARTSVFESRRGQASVLGVALLIGVVFIASFGVLSLAAGTITELRHDTMTKSNSYAMSRLDSEVSQVAANPNVKSGRVDFGRRLGGNVRTTQGGHMKINVIDQSDGSTKTILSRDLGAVQYKSQGGGIVAYQAGGVWKITEGGATVITPPAFNYQGQTLTLPLVTINSKKSTVDSRYVQVKHLDTTKVYPNPDEGETNPLKNAKVVITVTSKYYQAWGEYFEERAGTTVKYHHDKNQVQVTLVTPYRSGPIQNSAVSAGTVVIQASGGGGDFTDSYNSEKGTYELTQSDEGDIIARGSVKIQGSATINGDIESGKSVTLGGGTKVKGNISYVEKLKCKGKCDYTGWANDNASVDSLKPVDSLISDKVDKAKKKNDNDQTPYLTENGKWRGDGRGEEITLSAGTYYVTESLASGTTLKLDTSDGNVIIVSDQKKIDWKTVDIQPVNKNPENNALVYTTADTISMGDSDVGDQLTDDATWLRLYGMAGLDMTMKDKSTFTGLIYAPSSEATKGTIVIKGSDTAVYGGIVGGGDKLEISSGAAIHFDKSLMDEKAILTGGTAVPRVTYLHITVNEVYLKG